MYAVAMMAAATLYGHPAAGRWAAEIDSSPRLDLLPHPRKPCPNCHGHRAAHKQVTEGLQSIVLWLWLWLVLLLQLPLGPLLSPPSLSLLLLAVLPLLLTALVQLLPSILLLLLLMMLLLLRLGLALALLAATLQQLLHGSSCVHPAAAHAQSCMQQLVSKHP
jgi:hypothetical protein